MHWTDRAPADDSLIPLFPPALRCATFSLTAGPNDQEAHALLLRWLRESSPYLEQVEILDISRSWVASSSPIHDLRELSVTSTGPALVGLFDLVRFQALESATIDIAPSLDAEKEIKDVLKTLYGAIPTGTLRHFTPYVNGSGVDAGRTLCDLVRPILTLREICSFKFDRGHRHRDPRGRMAEAGAPLSLDSLPPSYRPAPHPRALSEPLGDKNIWHPLPRGWRTPDPRAAQFESFTVSSTSPVVDRHRVLHTPRKDAVADEHAEMFARYLLELFPALDTGECAWWWDKAASRPTKEVARHRDERKVLAHMYSIRASEQDRL